MRRAKATTGDVDILRQAMRDLVPGAAHQAKDPVEPEEIFAPPQHANALNPSRALVYGNRGVGKSFWSAAITHSASRARVAELYPRLRLDNIRAVLGFHEAAGKDEGPAPSLELLNSLLKGGYESKNIWRGVLIKALRSDIGEKGPESLKDTIDFMNTHIEETEMELRRADSSYAAKGKTFLLVFDALDRLADDWDATSKLTNGVLRLALDLRGFRAIKAKIFMRTDQYHDDTLFGFADASKIRTDAVNLAWRRSELYGLLYNYILRNPTPEISLMKLSGSSDLDELRSLLSTSEEEQAELFYRLAGQYMGAGPKRGRTYFWLYDHLADAFGETSPRSFITAIRKAAEMDRPPSRTAIDDKGIRAGVQDASAVRVQQLKEDYPWIEDVMQSLSGLEVPSDPSIFKDRWRERRIVEKIRNFSVAGQRLPLELADYKGPEPEDALLRALNNIGVIEPRGHDRINMPDIFRVAAGIKRRGGVRPPLRRQ